VVTTSAASACAWPTHDSGLLPLQSIFGRDAQHVSFQAAYPGRCFSARFQGLIPRHIIEDDCEVALHTRIYNDIQSADFVNQPEEVAQIGRPSSLQKSVHPNIFPTEPGVWALQ